VFSAVHQERNVREEQHHIYVARTSNNGVIAAHELDCCLLPQYETLRTCRSGFLIATLFYRKFAVIKIEKSILNFVQLTSGHCQKYSSVHMQQLQ